MHNRYNEYIQKFRETLPIGKSFDVAERKISIGGKDASIFYIEGLVSRRDMQWLLEFLLEIRDKDVSHAKSTDEFVKSNIPFLNCAAEVNTDTIFKMLFSGLVPMVIDGYDEVIVLDVRQYPARGVEEPEKEKTLRGAKDGFIEGLMTNIALIRRRIRDPRLIFQNYVVGGVTKTDVCIAYMEGVADQSQVDKIGQKLAKLKISTITVGEQTLIEALSEQDGKKTTNSANWFNPFPKVRYTQRPDVVAAHITEGKIALVVDNTPTVIMLPAGIFDFMQDVDDYYFPAMTGNYFRILRIANFLMILFMTPIYLLIVKGDIITSEAMSFLIPPNDFAIPLFWQFILLEIAIDALRLASLNTPNSLGMSLSVIGALILGEFSVQSGWFIPQTILCMAVVALASFTQPSIELGYGIKFMRLLVLIGAHIFSFWGASIGLLIGLLVMGTTKTLVGTSYLYPLIPLNKTALKRLLLRTKAGKEK